MNLSVWSLALLLFVCGAFAELQGEAGSNFLNEIPVPYRRSALDKNFIRFGRSQSKINQQPVEPNDYSEDGAIPSGEEDLTLINRPVSRSVQSNFLRFGRSFFPVEDYNRYGRSYVNNMLRFGRSIQSPKN